MWSLGHFVMDPRLSLRFVTFYESTCPTRGFCLTPHASSLRASPGNRPAGILSRLAPRAPTPVPRPAHLSHASRSCLASLSHASRIYSLRLRHSNSSHLVQRLANPVIAPCAAPRAFCYRTFVQCLAQPVIAPLCSALRIPLSHLVQRLAHSVIAPLCSASHNPLSHLCA